MPERLVDYLESKSKLPVEYSVVIPVYNEEESLKILFEELLRVFTPLKVRYEIIFVDDCSNDRSKSILENFNKEFPEAIKVIRLNSRSGQTAAMKAGFGLASGNIVFTLDSDLQNDPADIIKIIAKLKEGFDCVCGWRKSRQDTSLKAFLSKTANMIQRVITGLKAHDVSCTLRGYKKECIKNIPLNWPGQHRFIPLCLSLQGFKVGEIESNHRKRKFGASKYSHKRVFKVVFDFVRILIARGRK